MTSDSTDLHTLTGAYAMNALPDDERRRFEDHLESCPDCSREVVRLRETSVQLGAAAAEPPPAGLRDRILHAAEGTEQLPPADRPASRPDPEAGRERRGRVWALRLTAAAAAVLAIAVGGLSFLVADLSGEVEEAETLADQARQTEERFVDLLGAPDAELASGESDTGASARVVASVERGQAVIVAEGLEPTAPGSIHQLWFIGEAGARPAGLLDAGADGRAAELMSGDLRGTDLIGVTVEPAGGSPQPTTDPVLVIALH